jgi:predicted kinase
MKNPLVVIISGPPCSGKSTLANKLSRRFSLPLVMKDEIKETLFDELGIEDREWSKKLGKVSYKVLFALLRQIVSSGASCIVESNFSNQYDTDNFLEIKNTSPFQVVQIQCKTDGKLLLERFKKRSLSSERHPGHLDHNNIEEFRQLLLKGKLTPLDIDGELLWFDSSDVNNLDYSSITSVLEQFISSP